MRRYLAYLNYVLKHKWYVLLECCKLGIPVRGLLHDMSKFKPSEFIPYAKFFYNSDGTKKQVRDKTGYYKPTDTGDKNFDRAWFYHQARNKHHWQYWVMPEMEPTLPDGSYEKTYKVFPMDEKSLKEMFADWKGAGKAQGTPDVENWYRMNREKMILHKDTLKWFDNLIQ